MFLAHLTCAEGKNGDRPANLLAVGKHRCKIFQRKSFALRSKLFFCRFLKMFFPVDRAKSDPSCLSVRKFSESCLVKDQSSI